jgi:hypothetical protein
MDDESHCDHESEEEKSDCAIEQWNKGTAPSITSAFRIVSFRTVEWIRT